VVKSSRARQKIKHWLNIHQRERAIEIGRKVMEKEARRYRIAHQGHQGRRTCRRPASSTAFRGLTT
jgi:(p)ppGpp synthase/HD superfamily hydrolase